jgi:hypothetical protein
MSMPENTCPTPEPPRTDSIILLIWPSGGEISVSVRLPQHLAENTDVSAELLLPDETWKRFELLSNSGTESMGRCLAFRPLRYQPSPSQENAGSPDPRQQDFFGPPDVRST